MRRLPDRFAVPEITFKERKKYANPLDERFPREVVVEAGETAEGLVERCEELAIETKAHIRAALAELEEADGLIKPLEQNLDQYVANLKSAATLAQGESGLAMFYDNGYFIELSAAQIASRAKAFAQNLEYFNAQPADLQYFRTEGIKLLDRYSTDTKNLEAIRNTPVSVHLLTPSKEAEQRVASGFIEGDTTTVSNMEQLGELEVVADGVYVLSFDTYEQADFEHFDALNDFYFNKGKAVKDATGKRPVVLAYIPAPIPHYFRERYPGVSIVTNAADLQAAIYNLRSTVLTRTQQPEFMEAQKLSASQEGLYNKRETSLRKWESQTADTKQSLENLLAAERQRSAGDYTDNSHQRYLDLGVGNGRIAVPWVMLGHEVVGMDIAEKQLKNIFEEVDGEPARCEEVIDEFIAQTKTDFTGAVTSPLAKLYLEGKLKGIPVETSLAEIQKKIRPVKGDFAKLVGWLCKEFDREVASEFDGVTMNWHTFCEAGSIEGQRTVLQQIFHELKNDGFVYLEIPDRTVGAYAVSLAKYHEKHPNEPYGTIRDETSTKPGGSSTTEEGEDTPRFFPGRDELVNLLKEVGFVNVSVDTYLITTTDAEGKQHLQVKELVLTAQKPQPWS